MAKTLSKMFRVFVAGATISDGRTITPEMIDQCVATFNRETYSPRINIEHIAGYSPEPPFNGYGDVVALEARDVDLTVDGKISKFRALYAQVEANDQLVKLGKADQKPFPSVELTDSYASTGKFGLIGLAFTDTPASIGTERLQFSRTAPGSVFATGDATGIEFEAPAVDQSKADGAIASFFTALTAKFSGKSNSADEPKNEPQTPPAPANDNVFDAGAFARDLQSAVTGAIAAGVKPGNEALAELKAEFTALRTKVEATPAGGQFQRQPATGAGGSASVLTDC